MHCHAMVFIVVDMNKASIYRRDLRDAENAEFIRTFHTLRLCDKNTNKNSGRHNNTEALKVRRLSMFSHICGEYVLHLDKSVCLFGYS